MVNSNTSSCCHLNSKQEAQQVLTVAMLYVVLYVPKYRDKEYLLHGLLHYILYVE